MGKSQQTNGDEPLATRERLLTKEEAAEFLAVAPRFIERCVDERRIRFVRVGRYIRIPASALDEFVTARTVEPDDRRPTQIYRWSR